MSNLRIDAPTHNRGIERVLNSDQNLWEAVGFPVTKQFRAIADKYLKPLTHLVTDALYNCHGNRDRLVRSAILSMGLSEEDVALRILVAAGEAGSTAVHSFGVTAWWLPLGKALGFKGELALKVGEWAFDLLLRLPIFGVALDDGNLALALGEDGLNEFLDATLRQSALHRPDLLPLKQPPVPWTQVDQGVFPPDHEIKLKLINSFPSVEEAWRQAIDSGQMSEALRAINYQQSIPYRINKPILALLHKQEPPVRLPKPKPWHTRQWGLYMKAGAKAWEWNYLVGAADILSEWGRFYVPLRFDPRGRLNSVCHFAYQRADFCRALFLFDNGEPIGPTDGDGMLYLMAHVAARADGVCWGGVVHKPSAFDLDGRKAWTEQHTDRLLRIGKDILAGTDLQPDDLPSEDDDRYQFAAACLELAQAYGNPGFTTRLPCNFDGSCNGPQHLCYIVRALEGELVNLLPSATKQDCYGEATKIVMKSCGHLLKDIPGPRKIIKPTGMTFGYGSGKGGWSQNKKGEWEAHGMTRQVLEELEDRGLPTTWIKRENGEWEPATEVDWIGIQNIKALNKTESCRPEHCR